MSISRILKWTTGAFEAVLGVPILGAAIVIGFLWAPRHHARFTYRHPSLNVERRRFTCGKHTRYRHFLHSLDPLHRDDHAHYYGHLPDGKCSKTRPDHTGK